MGNALRREMVPSIHRNEFGFDDLLGPDGNPICPQCNSDVMPNKGQGMLCNRCNNEFLDECIKDYKEGHGMA